MLLTRHEVIEKYKEKNWRHAAFCSLVAELEEETCPYPCVFGVRALATDQLRFSFLNKPDVRQLGKILKTYLASSRSIGSITSLVVFFRARPAS